MFRYFLPALLGMLCAASQATAQQKPAAAGTRPNFSGVWKLNLEKSDFGELPPPESRTDSIDHNEPVLKDLTDEKDPQGERQYTITITTDGRENVNTIEGVTVKSTGLWKGDTLVTTAAFEYQESDVSMTNTLKLSEDGKTLIVDSQLTSDLGEMDQHFIYDRQNQ